jgi:hypothetical protein
MEASEQVAGLLGENSDFHHQHGFFVDGVDERTASLPPDWRERQIVREVETSRGGRVRAVAPCATDIVAAKLHRGDPKDQEFASRCMRLGLTHYTDVLQSIRRVGAPGPVREHAERMLRAASRKKNDFVASKGPERDDPLEVMFKRLKGRRTKDGGR